MNSMQPENRENQPTASEVALEEDRQGKGAEQWSEVRGALRCCSRSRCWLPMTTPETHHEHSAAFSRQTHAQSHAEPRLPRAQADSAALRDARGQR